MFIATGSKPTKPPIPGIDRDNVYWANNVFSGDAPVGKNNIIIGGGWTGGWNKVVNFPTTLRDSLEGNTWVARRTVPCLDGVNIIRSWSAMNINIDGAPILGEMPGVPGFYNTVSSNGYTLGPILGKATSELIARGKSVHDISFCSLDRFN